MDQHIICYMPALEGQSEDIRSYLDGAGKRYGIVPVILPAVDWNNDLTPWPSGPIFKKGKSFGGKAEDYLVRLQEEILPRIEAELGFVPEERWLVGVSLAGLFALWAAARVPLFTRVGCISGSFWYPGFASWLQEQPLYADAVYLSLGDLEAQGRNPHLKNISSDTETVRRMLEAKGVKTTFEWTEGTHFGPVLPRLEKALGSLSRA